MAGADTGIPVGAPCPVCGTAADALASTCASCGAFLRDRVAALNFFETAYAMVENPGGAFLRIARSEQKNYVVMLWAFSGIAYATFAMFVARVGDRGWHFATLLAAVFLAGPLLGMLAGLFSSWAFHIVIRRIFRLPVRFRLASSFVAWSAVPLLLVSFVLAPIELGVFGDVLFSVNPAPWALKPAIFWTLVALNAAAIAWEILLSSMSARVVGATRVHCRTATFVAQLVIAAIIATASFLCMFVA
jgi:hypothetical protein